MKLRPPAIPLITVDPFFSVWSRTDKLYDSDTTHWTGRPHKLCGILTVDGEDYRFMGAGEEPVIEQTAFDFDALSTSYTFRNEKVTLKLRFMTPLLPDNLDILTRPVSYLSVSARPADGKKHTVTLKLTASEQLCLSVACQSAVDIENVDVDGAACIRMGNHEQNVLNRSGDNHSIDWGYFYLAVHGKNAGTTTGKQEAPPKKDAPDEKREMHYVGVTADLSEDALVLFGYDDIHSINYFGDHLPSYWNRNGKTLAAAMGEAVADYETLVSACKDFADKLYLDGVRAGGKKYAEILELTYRQAFASHKLIYTSEGEIVFISKECFSNGCAGTVDVSYPSIPLFLIYNPELVRGMMRPIYKFAASDAWKFDFAPHDVGHYPLVTGQYYGLNKETGELRFESQMPVEECGNMLIMEAATLLADGNTDFAASHMGTLEQWVKYLLQYGGDPENQLCTDDFAGHLAHNCNLSLKAIMGIAAFAIINRELGNKRKANKYMAEAKKMASSWCERAANGDGSYRLAFDRPGTFSMKYNAVWDKVFGTDIFPAEVISSELFSNFKHFNAYGMPLDNRADYTKSDWLIWTATMLDDDDDFERFVAPLWNAYNSTTSRVPMTDWYYTTTAVHSSFVNRTVVGGHFMRVLRYLDKLNLKKR